MQSREGIWWDGNGGGISEEDTEHETIFLVIPKRLCAPG